MPRDVLSSKNSTGRYRAHPDITIRNPAPCRELPARDIGPDCGSDATGIAPMDIGHVRISKLMKSEERA
jgi:hypothetical protein